MARVWQWLLRPARHLCDGYEIRRAFEYGPQHHRV